MPIKLNDFVEIEYTGKLKEGNIVFDTTDAEVAKANALPQARYGAVVVCIGQGQLLKGLEDKLVGKGPGKYVIELPAEQAFGKKNAKLIQMIPTKKFLEQKIQPVPGLKLDIDGMVCSIIQVTGGRAMVDFNHPFASKDVVYDVKVNKIITDKKEQLKAIFTMLLRIEPEAIAVEDDRATVTLKQQLPEQLIPELQKKIKELAGLDADIKAATNEDIKPEEAAEKQSKTAAKEDIAPEKAAEKRPKTAAQ